jgi:uncharacterized MAPEG superfamily protein
MDRIPFICIAYAMALVFLPRQIVGDEMKKLAGGYDNSDPRGQQAQLAGRGKRALAAHQNGFEAFAPFAAAVLMAMGRVRIELLDALALAFVVARTIYVVMYLNDKPKLRSPMWGIGLLCTAALMISAIVGV